jgi:pimeloyl-ACP methyl ester carboxylesterase
MDKSQVKILILHGWGSSAQNWSKVKDALESRGAEVILPDLPGFGQNLILDKPWSVDDYAQWVFDFCQKQGLSQFFLLGHSFGGGIAVKLASSFPLAIRGLILASPALKRRKGPVYWFVLFWAKIGKFIFSLPPFSFLQPLARKIIYFIIGKRDYYRLEDETIKKTFRNVVEKDMIGYLPKINIPTLIIWGDKDMMTPFKDASLVQKGIKNSQLEIVKGANHALNLHNAEILAEKVLNFTNKL